MHRMNQITCLRKASHELGTSMIYRRSMYLKIPSPLLFIRNDQTRFKSPLLLTNIYFTISLREKNTYFLYSNYYIYLREGND